MRINEERLQNRLSELARIGAQPGGGVTRLAFSREDRLGRDFVEARIRAMGLVPRVDAIGNLAAVRPGTEPTSGVIMMGSHTDTVGSGGRFDGALGVLAALEVLETLTEQQVQTRRGVGLLSFVNEEGVRFMPDMMGSLYLRGDLDTPQVRGISGSDGSTIGANLDRHGMSGTDDFRQEPIAAFLELHIEQGPVLETRDTPVGIVTGVQGLRWMEVTVDGTSNHAGTTPMAHRRDAGLVAAQIAVDVRTLTRSEEGLRGTVGRVVQQPNLINVIASQAMLTVDLRHPDQARLDAMVSRLSEMIRARATEEGVAVSIRETASAPAVDFDPGVVGAIEGAVGSLGLPLHRLISGAGHDAQIMARHCPAGMIFIRSQGGISHNPAEFSRPEDVAAGANVLLLAALNLAG